MRHAAMFLRQSCPLANGDALRCMHAPRRLGWASLSGHRHPRGADRDARRTQPAHGRFSPFLFPCGKGDDDRTVRLASRYPCSWTHRSAVCPGRSEIRVSLTGWAHF